jgi:hypothetical protein
LPQARSGHLGLRDTPVCKPASFVVLPASPSTLSSALHCADRCTVTISNRDRRADGCIRASGDERGGFVGEKRVSRAGGAKAIVRWSLTAQAKNRDRAGAVIRAAAPAARDECEGRMRLARGLGKTHRMRLTPRGRRPPRVGTRAGNEAGNQTRGRGGGQGCRGQGHKRHADRQARRRRRRQARSALKC